MNNILKASVVWLSTAISLVAAVYMKDPVPIQGTGCYTTGAKILNQPSGTLGNPAIIGFAPADKWVTDTGVLMPSTVNLQYPTGVNLASSGGSFMLKHDSTSVTSSGRMVARKITGTAPNSSTLYFTMLLSFNHADALASFTSGATCGAGIIKSGSAGTTSQLYNNGLYFGFWRDTSDTPGLLFRLLGNNYTLVANPQPNTTYYCIARVDLNAEGNKEIVRVAVNPTVEEQYAFAYTNDVATAWTDFTHVSMGGFYSTKNREIYFDELCMASTWADVMTGNTQMPTFQGSPYVAVENDAFVIHATLANSTPDTVVYAAYGRQYGGNTSPVTWEQKAVIATHPVANQDVSLPLPGLAPDTCYTYGAFASNSVQMVYADGVPSAFYNGELSVATLSDAHEDRLNPGYFRISRATTADATRSPLSVNFSLSGDAVAGQDYTASALTAVIPEGAAYVDVRIIPLVTAHNTSPVLTLTLAPGLYLRSVSSSATMTIHNFDSVNADDDVSKLIVYDGAPVNIPGGYNTSASILDQKPVHPASIGFADKPWTGSTGTGVGRPVEYGLHYPGNTTRLRAIGGSLAINHSQASSVNEGRALMRELLKPVPVSTNFYFSMLMHYASGAMTHVTENRWIGAGLTQTLQTAGANPPSDGFILAFEGNSDGSKNLILRLGSTRFLLVPNAAPDTTYFCVAHIQPNDGGNNETVRVSINPNTFQGESWQFTFSTVDFLGATSSLKYLAYGGNYAVAGSFVYFDEFRLGYTYAGVAGTADALPSQTIQLHPQGGTVSPTSLTVTRDAPIGTLPLPQRLTHAFDGWFDDLNEPVDEDTLVTANLTDLYAAWTPIPIPLSPFRPLPAVTVDSDGANGVVITAILPEETPARITLPDFLTIDDIDYPITAIHAIAANADAKLKTITLPAGITTIAENAFANCDQLEQVIFRGAQPVTTDTPFPASTPTIYVLFNDTTWDNAVADASWLGYPIIQYGTVDIPLNDATLTVYIDINGIATLTGLSGTSTLTFPETVTNESITYPLTGIASETFKNNTELSSLTFLDAPVKFGQNIFAGLPDNQITITVPFGLSWDTLLDITGAFADDSARLQGQRIVYAEGNPQALDYAAWLAHYDVAGTPENFDKWIAGVNPQDSLDVFYARIHIINNQPAVSWIPNLGRLRVYQIQAKTELSDADWRDISTDETTAPENRFFRVQVDLLPPP